MSKTKTYDLLPCPFCGEPPKIELWNDILLYQIFCRGPHCQVQPQVTGTTARRAIMAWNTRGGKAPHLPKGVSHA